MNNSAPVSCTLTETQQRFAGIADMLGHEPGVNVGSSGKKGFGSFALQANAKIFVKVSSKGCFVVKLPKQRVEALEDSGTGRRFDPGHGRLMKEWLSLDPSSKGEWLSLAREALRFVGQK
jgi:hypothetical protein